MKLFLSNPTKQRQEFQFRLDIAPRGSATESSSPHSVMLESGHQTEIGPGCEYSIHWSKDQFEYVMRQLHRCGARDAAEAHGHLGKFTFLLYRIDAPVDEEEIIMGHDAIVVTQEQRSVEQTTKSALAFDRITNKLGKGRGRLTRMSQVEVHQESGPHDRLTGNEVHFDLTVDPNAAGNGAQLPI